MTAKSGVRRPPFGGCRCSVVAGAVPHSFAGSGGDAPALPQFLRGRPSCV